MFVVLRENKGDNYISLGPHPVRSCTCHMACHYELLGRKCDVTSGGAIPFMMKGLACDWEARGEAFLPPRRLAKANPNGVNPQIQTPPYCKVCDVFED
jgi:hypothetical protein